MHFRSDEQPISECQSHSAGLRLWRSWCTEKHEAPLQILKLQKKIDFHFKILQ